MLALLGIPPPMPYARSEEPKVAEAEDAGPTEIVWAPREAVVQTGTGPTVFLVSDGRAVARSVTTGREGPRGIAVEQGLIGTEQLILNPPAEVRDGRRVEPLP